MPISAWKLCRRRAIRSKPDHLVPWESFRADIEAVVLTPDEVKKSSAGRKPLDAIVSFRMVVLQALHNLSDEQVEYQVRDRLSFTRFLQLGIEDSIPDATTLWLFRREACQGRADTISAPNRTGGRRRLLPNGQEPRRRLPRNLTSPPISAYEFTA